MKYPTVWQRKTMWAALTAIFIVVLITIGCSVVWLGANVVGFIQPILIPVAIAVILAYLLDPVVTWMCERGLGRTRAVVALFAIAFLSIGVLVAWLAPIVSMQATNVGRELPQYTQKARDTLVDLIYKYDTVFGAGPKPTKRSSPTSTLLNWLFAAPTPAGSLTPAPSEPPPSPAATPMREEIGPATEKITTAERQRIQARVQTQLPNLERQLPYIGEKIWTL